MYLPDRCEANAISLLLPSNNKLHVESSTETPQHKLGFKRSYSKINSFNLIQLLNLTSLTDNKLQDLAHKILEMKQMSIYSINITSMASIKLRGYPNNFWPSVKVKTFSTMDTLVSSLGILALVIGLYYRCFWNKINFVH